MSEPELNDALAQLIDAVSDFTELTDAFYRNMLQAVAGAVGFDGDAGWPPSDEFIDFMAETFNRDDFLADLSVDEGAEVLGLLDQIRQMREGSA